MDTQQWHIANPKCQIDSLCSIYKPARMVDIKRVQTPMPGYPLTYCRECAARYVALEQVAS